MNRLHDNSIWERGQTLVIASLALVFLLGAAAIAVDLGYLRYVRREMQSATDSAAIAGASEINYGDVQTAADEDASKNGFTDSTNGVSVTVNNPPLSGPHDCASDANCSEYVEVIISQPQTTFFAKIFGIRSATVRTRAVGYGGASGFDCIYALNPSTNNAYDQSSGSASTQANCGIIVDSTSSSAMTVSGGGTVTASAIGIAGGLSSSGGSTVSPAPTTGVIPEPDPLSYLSAPSPPLAPAQDSLNLCTISGSLMTCNIKAGQTSASGTSPGPDVLYPGLYSGISLSGGSYVVLSPGLYYIEGGGINSSGGSYISGTGVTIYNTGTLSNPSACKSVTVSGGGTVDLTAPTSTDTSAGTVEGVLLFQNRACNARVTFSGGSSYSITGALYAADANLTYSGGSTGQNNYTILVADTITISGGSAVLDNNYSSLSHGSSPIHRVVLAE